MKLNLWKQSALVIVVPVLLGCGSGPGAQSSGATKLDLNSAFNTSYKIELPPGYRAENVKSDGALIVHDTPDGPSKFEYVMGIDLTDTRIGGTSGIPAAEYLQRDVNMDYSKSTQPIYSKVDLGGVSFEKAEFQSGLGQEKGPCFIMIAHDGSCRIRLYGHPGRTADEMQARDMIVSSFQKTK